MYRKVITALTMVAISATLSWGQVPEILQIGNEEHVGSFNGTRPSIATDSKNQPHIVVDYAMSSNLRLYDKLGASWQETAFNVKNYNPSTASVFNPTIGIDTTTDTAWIGMVMFTCCVEAGCGLGIIVRENVATAPSGIHFSRNTICPILDWDPGMLKLDPSQPGYAVGYSYNGYYGVYKYDASRADRKKLQYIKNMFAGYGGEKNAFDIADDGTYHAATGGYSAYPSAYQNSIRAAAGAKPIQYASYVRYPIQGSDMVYPGVEADKKNPGGAYMACDFHTQGGICVNIWNGSTLVFKSGSNLAVDPNGTSGAERFSPQWAAAPNGGAFICWTRGARIKLRYIALDGTMGDEIDVCQGSRGNICFDSQGNMHLVYANGGVKYRKLSVSGAGGSAPTFACDFDGDGLDDIATYDNGVWHIRGSDDGGMQGYRGKYFAYKLGSAGDIPVPGDYDGDGKADPAVYEPGNENGSWWVYKTGTKTLEQMTGLGGNSGDTPVPADYDGDGKTDRCIWDKNGTWHVVKSGGGYSGLTLGDPSNGDIPVPGDYDGDGHMDIAVFQPNGTWHISMTSSGYVGAVYGQDGDIPIPQDYNGDGKWEIATYRPSDHTWRIYGLDNFGWGADGDLPVPGHFYKTNEVHAGVYRPSTGQWILWMNAPPRFGGGASDTPIAGVFDSDNRADWGIFRNTAGDWYIKATDGSKQSSDYGEAGDRSVPADYDGDGVDDKAVYRNGVWHIMGSTYGAMSYHFGQSGDTPVPADYDGDGKADPAIYQADGVWHINGTSNGYRGLVLGGAAGDTPIPLDIDGDGKIDPAIFDANATWHGAKSLGGGYWGMKWGNPGMVPVIGSFAGGENKALYDPKSRTFFVFPGAVSYQLLAGSSEMVPICADYDGDGIDDYAAFRDATGEWIIRYSSDGSYVLKPNAVYVQWGSSGIPIGVKGN